VSTLERKVAALGGDVHGPLEEISVPMYVVDAQGTIVWVNAAADKLLPGATGKKFTDLLSPDEVHPARRLFALRVLGKAPFTDHKLSVHTHAGQRHEVEISSAPLKRGHRIVGVFGVLRAERGPTRARPGGVTPPTPQPPLTPRQHEVLVLLSKGLTTAQMAERMALSPQTVQNHIKALLRALGVRSRLEAVLAGHRLGLVSNSELSSD
jgi:PAS domain S-box-containing protein